MPTVPRYTTNRNLVRTESSRVNTINPRQGSARFFGGNEAETRGKLGDIVANAGNAFMQYSIKAQDRKDKIIVRNKLNATREELREFATEVYRVKDTTGLDTTGLNAYDQMNKRIEDIRQRELKGMDNDSQVEYFAASFDELAQAHLSHAWQYQENLSMNLDLRTKQQENAIFHKEVRATPHDESAFELKQRRAWLNSVSLNAGLTPLEKARKNDEMDKKTNALVKKYGIDDEIIDIKRAPSGKITDDNPFYPDKEIMKASDKRLSEMDASKFTPRQVKMLNDREMEKLNRNFFQKFYYDYVVPATEFVQTTVEDAERGITNTSKKVREGLEERSLATALDKGRSIPTGWEHATQEATKEASKLRANHIFGIMESKDRATPYQDALRMYNEKRDEMLPEHRMQVFKAIRKGLNKENLNLIKLQSLQSGESMSTALQRVENSNLSPDAKIEAKKSITTDAAIREKARKLDNDKLFNSEFQRLLQNPSGYEVPIGIDPEVSNKLTVAKDKRLKEITSEKPKKSDPIEYARLSAMSNEDIRNLDMSAHPNVTTQDLVKLKDKAAKNSIDNQYYKAVELRVRGIRALNSGAFKNQDEKANASRRYANLMTAFRGALDQMPQAEKTSQNIDKLLDRLLLPKKVSTGIFSSEIIYAYELDFIRDEEFRKKASKEFIPEDIQEKYKEADSIQMDDGLVIIDMGANRLVIDPITRKSKKFIKQR